jgi:hypothetical protein
MPIELTSVSVPGYTVLPQAGASPVSLAGDPVSRYGRILASRITPHVRDVSIRVLRTPDEPDQVSS